MKIKIRMQIKKTYSNLEQLSKKEEAHQRSWSYPPCPYMERTDGSRILRSNGFIWSMIRRW